MATPSMTQSIGIFGWMTWVGLTTRVTSLSDNYIVKNQKKTSRYYFENITFIFCFLNYTVWDEEKTG